MNALYTINLMAMGTTNLSIGSSNSLFRMLYAGFELDAFGKKVAGALPGQCSPCGTPADDPVF